MRLHYGSLEAVSTVDPFMRIPLLKHLPGFRKSWANSVNGKEAFKQYLKEVSISTTAPTWLPNLLFQLNVYNNNNNNNNLHSKLSLLKP